MIHQLISLYSFIFIKKIDIDECETKTANCGPDEICKNKPGGYTCACPVGYSLNALRRCEDVDECSFYKGQVSKFESYFINNLVKKF